MNKQTLSRRELMKLNASICKLRNKLGDSIKTEKIEGYSENIFGSFWNKELYLKYINTYKIFLSGLEELGEPTVAMSYAYAAALREGLLFDEAYSLCIQILNENGSKVNFLNMLAFIEAGRGNEIEARRIAEEINSSPDGGGSFRVHMPDLETYIEKGRVWSTKSIWPVSIDS